MLFTKSLIRLIAVMLIALLLYSCSPFVSRHVKKVPPYPFAGKTLRLIWDKKGINNLYMSEITLSDSTLSGNVEAYQHKGYDKRKDTLVNLYMDPKSSPPDSLPGKVTLPLSQITRIEVYDFSIGVVILDVVLVGIGLVVVASILVLLLKESCPFIYTYDGETYDFTGEIYSGAVYPNLERDDYLPLPGFKQVNQQYQLKMTNQVREIQSTNLAELLIINHPIGSQVLVDKYGKCHTIQLLHSPKTAYASDNTNVLPLIAAQDNQKFLSNASETPKQKMNSLTLDFERPQGADTANLVVRAKNSFWLDITLGQFFNMFGDKYNTWYQKQKNTPASQQQQWSLEQGIPLSVYVEKHGKWEFVDYFNVIGPMAEKDVVMPIDLSGLDADTIKLKLECGFMFWEIDHVAMDFSPQQQVEQQFISLSSGTDHNGLDVKSLLNKDDKDYFVMPDIDNQAILVYDAPPLPDNESRTVFLHSKGHYEVLRDPEGKPNVTYLKSFLKPGKLNQFSRDRYDATLKQARN